MTNLPAQTNEQLPLAKKLDACGISLDTTRNPGESNEAYADRLITAIDVTIQELWDLQDKICTLLIDADPAA